MKWWLSFAGEEGSRGVCIVHARDFLEAVAVANISGCSPGGQVLGHPVDGPAFDDDPVATAEWKWIDSLPVGKLIKREDMGDWVQRATDYTLDQAKKV